MWPSNRRIALRRRGYTLSLRQLQPEELGLMYPPTRGTTCPRGATLGAQLAALIRIRISSVTTMAVTAAATGAPTTAAAMEAPPVAAEIEGPVTAAASRALVITAISRTTDQ